MDLKVCSKCQQRKLIDQFHKSSRAASGVVSRCKTCVKDYQVVWREATKERRQNWQREYYYANRETVREYQQGYSQRSESKIKRRRRWTKNRESINAVSRANYAANIEKKREQRREWDRLNPERAKAANRRKYRKHKSKHLEWNRQRRARQRNAKVERIRPLSQMVKEQGNKCYICSQRFTKRNPAVVEHYIPLAKGGEHSNANTMAAHHSCNAQKHAALPADHARRLGRLLI